MTTGPTTTIERDAPILEIGCGKVIARAEWDASKIVDKGVLKAASIVTSSSMALSVSDAWVGFMARGWGGVPLVVRSWKGDLCAALQQSTRLHKG